MQTRRSTNTFFGECEYIHEYIVAIMDNIFIKTNFDQKYSKRFLRYMYIALLITVTKNDEYDCDNYCVIHLLE